MAPSRQKRGSILVSGAKTTALLGGALLIFTVVRCLWFGLSRNLEEVCDLPSASRLPKAGLSSAPSRLSDARVSLRGERVGRPVNLKVMSYNLNHSSRGNDNSPQNAPHFPPGTPEWKKICLSISLLLQDPGRLERNLVQITSLIAAEDPDIVFLQDVDRDVLESLGVDTAEWIARRAGYPYGIWGSKWSMDLGIKHVTGNAILSKYPILEAENIPLNPTDGKFFYRQFFGAHTLLAATVEIGGASVRLFNTHLYSKKYGYEKKEEQVAKFLDLVKTCRFPVIFGGDLNSSFSRLKSNKPASKDPTLPLLLRSGLVDPEGFFDEKTLDHILLRPGDPTRYLRKYKISPVATDHSIIVSLIELDLPHIRPLITRAEIPGGESLLGSNASF